ncbi:MAG: preprotein translocase subunit Sec61beta [Methanobacteriota archaeon]
MAKQERAGAGFQQAAGLIRYFDAEEETAIKIDPRLVVFTCFFFAVLVAIINYLEPL